MFCNQCGTEINDGGSFCPKCGTKVNTKNATEPSTQIHESDAINPTSHAASNENFFKKLSNGDFGLATTYWLYGVVVGFVVNMITKPIESLTILSVILIPYIIYEVFVMMGIWRAADRYEGAKLWAILAKIAVVLGALSIAFLVLVILAGFAGLV